MKDSGIPLAGGLESLISGVKAFLPAQKNLTLTRLVEALVDPAQAGQQALAETDEYLLFDPRSTRPSSGLVGRGSAAGKGRHGFGEAVVFVVGGGGYVEYTNLMEWADRSAAGGAGGQGVNGGGGGAVGAGQVTGSSSLGGGAGKRIVYGSTEILTPRDFVGVLAGLGAKS